MVEERASVRSAEPEPVFNCLPGPVRHLYESIFAALATVDREFVPVSFVVRAFKFDDL